MSTHSDYSKDSDSKFGGKYLERVDYTKWKGKNCFPCGGLFVTGPLETVGPSLILDFLLTMVTLIWFIVVLPYTLNPSFLRRVDSDGILIDTLEYRTPNLACKIIDILIAVVCILE